MKSLDLFEMLVGQCRLVAHVDSQARIVYTWNRERTLEAWKESSVRP